MELARVIQRLLKLMDWKALGKIFSSLDIADGKMLYFSFVFT